MKIAIEARALSRPASGVRTYVRQLIDALKRIEPANTYEVLEQELHPEALWPLWLNASVPRWLKTMRPDVVHFTKAATPFAPVFAKATVVTIYDVIPLLFPQSQKLLPRLLWPAILRHAARTADHIITISEASKSDIVTHLNVAPDKITVTPLAATPSAPEVRSPLLRTEGQAPYILFLSTLEPRKNVPALVRSFSRIAAQVPHQLLIAGRAYKGLAEIEYEIEKGGLDNRVKLLGLVAGDKLPALYATADLFVLPSLYEGWSFPSQEAMSYGVPVIVSNGGALPEVVGEAGEVVPFTVNTIAARTHDEAFEAALADRMLLILSDPARQARMREAGLRQVQKFSWDDVARKTLAVYHRIV